MVKVCCIFKCESKSSDSGAKKRSLFGFPKDQDKNQIWMDIVSPFLDKMHATKKCLYICDKHFKNSDVERTYRTVLKDGTVHEMPRDRLQLKRNCVPYFGDENENNLQQELMDTGDKTLCISTQDQCSGNAAIEYTFEALLRDLENPEHSSKTINWGSGLRDDGIFFIFSTPVKRPETTVLTVKKDMSIQARLHDTPIKLTVPDKIHHIEDLFLAMRTIMEIPICRGVDRQTPCTHGITELSLNQKSQRCDSCRAQRRAKIETEKKKAKRQNIKQHKIKKLIKQLKQQNKRMKSHIMKQKKSIEELHARCAAQSEKTVEDAIRNFPTVQQEAIRACLAAAKCKGPNGMRYTNDWILECLLIRIKSRKAYQHLRKHQILQLPTIDTLTKYLKNMKASYGFCTTTFRLLQTKAATMSMEDRRGTLVLDEMQLSEGVNFNREDMQFEGFTDLGEYTPADQRNQRGDHALVFLYQPFRGKWVQTVGAFLSKGCANSRVLNKLILECIILLEKADFHVDVVTTDGASWNRSMWKLFGIEGSNSGCIHPYPVNANTSLRKLWFCSDFSHLIKLLRNLIMSVPTIWTPDGIVKKSHFEAVLDMDRGKKFFGLKNAHKLTHHHLNPKFYQKMNVAMAFQVFESEVSTVMELYKKKDERLNDCEPTIAFLRRIHGVILAMTSRTPIGALKLNSMSFKAISDFQDYLEEWHDKAVENNWKFLSPGTYQGFQFTLKSTIGVLTYLCEHCGYDYLMTSRLNQDALEGNNTR